MGNSRTVRRLGEISKKFDPDILFLLETKNPNDVVLKKLDHLRYDCNLLVPPTGHGAGGLALFWKQELNLQVLNSSPNVIDTVIEFEGNRFYASFIYGNTDRTQRRNLWDHLLDLSNARDEAWFITGDFNDILCSDEKDGGTDRPEGSFSDFRPFFSEGDLFDLQHTGDPLSWRGNRVNGVVRCRLDRAASNTKWAENFPSARCQYLGFEGSDHKPLISFFDKGGRRKRGIFRYDRRLCKNEEAKSIITAALTGCSEASVSEKLAHTRGAISLWNRNKQRNSKLVIEKKKRELNEALSEPFQDTAKIQDINKQLTAAYLAEEDYWRQRSRLLWLKLGDRNTGYFHAITKSRKRANAFSVLEDADGKKVVKEEEIIEVIGAYFDKLFTYSPL